MSVCATGWAGGGWQTIIPWPALGIKILRSVSRSELSSSPELDQDHGCNLKPKTCGQNETVQPQGHGKLSTRLEEMELDLTNISNSASLRCSSQMQWLVRKPILAVKDFPRSKVLSLALSIVCFVFVIKPTKVWINLKHTWLISVCTQIEKKDICNFWSPVRRYCAKSPRTVKSHNNCWNLPAISANSCEPECLDNSRWRRSKADF